MNKLEKLARTMIEEFNQNEAQLTPETLDITFKANQNILDWLETNEIEIIGSVKLTGGGTLLKMHLEFVSAPKVED